MSQAAVVPTETAPACAPAYAYSNNWFDSVAKPTWDQLIPQIKPKTMLEIGSYEGASACYLIAKLAQETPIEIHCIDTWEGGLEHKSGGVDMQSVESRFQHNIRTAMASVPYRVDFMAHKGTSDLCLANLIAQGRSGAFDLAYVDGSHQAPDVLSDAVLAFKLLKVGGYMFFDDYLWAEDMVYGRDPLRAPKPAIDAFVNCYFRKVRVLAAPLYQLYVQKVAA